MSSPAPPLATSGPVSGSEGCAVVSHDPLDEHAVGREPGHGAGEEAGAGRAAFVIEDLDVGEPGGVIDTDMDQLLEPVRSLQTAAHAAAATVRRSSTTR